MINVFIIGILVGIALALGALVVVVAWEGHTRMSVRAFSAIAHATRLNPIQWVMTWVLIIVWSVIEALSSLGASGGNKHS